jgi:TM2 domain-containing membrane protein YozV/RNA polymerase subunit RPABC4/transcription elongation factor Spt4
MKHCLNCGEEINENAEICTECGVNQAQLPEGSHGDRGESEKYCRECGELINKQSEICPECGVRQEVGTGQGDSSSNSDQVTAGVLAILLGGIGVHKFYQGNNKLGILYLCFSWTFIPAIIAFIEGILILMADEDEYEEKYADGSILGN